MNTCTAAVTASCLRPGPALRCLSLALIGLFSLALPAHAQWMWQDASGQRIFSDTPPPPGTPERLILRRPAGSTAPAAATGTAPAPAPAGSTPPAPATATNSTPAGGARPPVARDPELEARLKQSQSQEEQKRKEEEARLAKVKADNCERARQAKASLDSGVRLARVNAKGEREFLDEKARATEMQRAQQSIAENCN